MVFAMKLISTLAEHHIVQLHALYQREWWTKGRSLDATRSGVHGSQIVLGMVDERDQLQAFVRVLTDFTFKALILDVIVAEPARQQGLGRRLMQLVMGHHALQGVRHFELYCLPELVEFYSSYGFSEDVGRIRFMRMVRPERG
jgi:predicted GNAT family N-acyltransferase